MKKKKRSLQSKLFLVLTSSTIIIILLIILVNSFIYKPFYIFSKQVSLAHVCRQINKFDFEKEFEKSILELEKMAAENGIDIVLKSREDRLIYSSNKDFLSNIEFNNNYQVPFIEFSKDDNNLVIGEVTDTKTAIRYLSLNHHLDNGYELFLRLAISPIEDSIRISNIFLSIIGTFIIIVSGVVISVVSKKLMEPIGELECIAKKMANLDFSAKYRVKDVNDEINNLGKSINLMSMQLEKTIRKLQTTNLELEKDIEEKSKLDEMRKQFISDVSHELKTPIALIQGYAEGLHENINSDEESRKFYTEVILDEANKMDSLVKKLLELMKLEYCTREFNNAEFNIVELINEVIRKSKVLLDEADVKVQFDDSKKFIVNADAFYIEQIITNYLTNAIKNVEEVNGEKFIRISLEETVDKEKNGNASDANNLMGDNSKLSLNEAEGKTKTKITVFNTGRNIPIEDMNRIWNRFYKIDTSRNREQGGNGIGLAFVKAIMNNYDNRYGVENKENGVEFYIEL